MKMLTFLDGPLVIFTTSCDFIIVELDIFRVYCLSIVDELQIYWSVPYIHSC